MQSELLKISNGEISIFLISMYFQLLLIYVNKWLIGRAQSPRVVFSFFLPCG